MRIIGNGGTAPRKVQAVASGALASGDTVVVNSDGTVSVVAETSATQAIGTAVTIEAASSDWLSSTFDTNSNKIVVVYRDGTSGYGTAIVGTVGASDNSISFGSEAVFESSATTYISCTFDSSTNKVVVAYRDSNNSNYGTAIIGTVSGTSISFGTAVVFQSAATKILPQGAVFDTLNNRVVICYNAASEHGTASVGTVSGTGISFGTAVKWVAYGTDNQAAVFDSGSNKVVIAFRNGVASNNDRGHAIVGTVDPSDNSISFGDVAAFEDSSTKAIAIAFDSSANKTLIAYSDFGDSNKGKAVVASVSGTSISFGSPVIFEAGSTSSANQTSATCDSVGGKVVVTYADIGDSDKGKLVVGTISGTSVSFTSPLEFDPQIGKSTATFDSNSNKVVISYPDGANSRSESTVFQPAYTATNLTSENYIGIASNGYATGQAATINAKGFIDDNQSSLTAGQSYYVQTNGDLGLTAADPSVFAGTAVSATKLIVKG